MSEIRIMKMGKVYQYRFEIASRGVVRRYINKSGFESRKEAQEAGVIAYNEYFRTGRKQKIKDMSYEDYLDYWMTNYCYFNVKYATIASYLNIIKNHLKPELGMYKLTQLDSYTIQNYINKLYKEKHYSKHYLKGILKLIKGSLKYACYTVNFINDNPAERVHIPKYDVVTGDPAHIFSQEEFEIILDRFKEVPYIYYSFLTAYYTGLRVSECYGLTWDNIDFEKKTLTVNKNIIKKNQNKLPKKYVITKGHSVEEWYYGTCKNPQSNRTIAIGDTLVKALKEYKKEQEVNKELTNRSNKLDQAITDLEIKMESNKPVLFEKESIKIKKDTFDSMNKVIEESKKISEMKPKLDKTYKAMKEQINTYSKVQQENYDLKDENENLKFQNTKLSNKISILENTINVLKRTIERVADFFYHLVADGLISNKKEEEIHNILGSDYKPYKEKSRDGGLSL